MSKTGLKSAILCPKPGKRHAGPVEKDMPDPWRKTCRTRGKRHAGPVVDDWPCPWWMTGRARGGWLAVPVDGNPCICVYGSVWGLYLSFPGYARGYTAGTPLLDHSAMSGPPLTSTGRKVLTRLDYELRNNPATHPGKSLNPVVNLLLKGSQKTRP